MARKKIATNVYLEPAQVRGLEEIHRRTRVPRSVLMRGALDLMIRMHDMAEVDSLEVLADAATAVRPAWGGAGASVREQVGDLARRLGEVLAELDQSRRESDQLRARLRGLAETAAKDAERPAEVPRAAE